MTRNDKIEIEKNAKPIKLFKLTGLREKIVKNEQILSDETISWRYVIQIKERNIEGEQSAMG